jgi:quercetin dioxygenase-like cupin family protein
MILGAASAVAQDPVKVDSKHYKVELENEYVRVVRITYGAAEKSVIHEHPAGVAVFLTDQEAKFTLPDGKTEVVQDKAGSIRWAAAGKHLPENTGGRPFELVLVELKTGPGTSAIAPAEDPVKVAPKECKVELENEYVRVLRWIEEPGTKTAMHAHPAMVSVPLTASRGRQILADGKTRETDSKPGQATFTAAERHSSELLSNQRSELIQVELKGQPTKPAGN